MRTQSAVVDEKRGGLLGLLGVKKHSSPQNQSASQLDTGSQQDQYANTIKSRQAALKKATEDKAKKILELQAKLSEM